MTLLVFEKLREYTNANFTSAEVEANSISQVLDYLHSSGGTTWPTFDEHWVESDLDLEEAFAAAQRQDARETLSTGPLIRLLVMKDYFEADVFRIQVSSRRDPDK